MNHSPSILGIISAVACLTACSSAPSRTAATHSNGPDQILQTLPDNDTPQSACPLVLWTRAEPSRRIFVAAGSPPQATVRINRKTLTLPRTASSGTEQLGHRQLQTFTQPDGITIVADIRFSPIGDDSSGAAIRSATVNYTSQAGESVVIPVIGLVSCEK